MQGKSAVPSEIAVDLNRSFQTGDIERICRSIGEAVKAYNIADVAKKSGLSRPSVYRAFAGGGAYPNLTTVVGVLGAMGLSLKVAVKRGDRAKPSRKLSRRLSPD